MLALKQAFTVMNPFDSIILRVGMCSPLCVQPQGGTYLFYSSNRSQPVAHDSADGHTSDTLPIMFPLQFITGAKLQLRSSIENNLMVGIILFERAAASGRLGTAALKPYPGSFY